MILDGDFEHLPHERKLPLHSLVNHLKEHPKEIVFNFGTHLPNLSQEVQTSLDSTKVKLKQEVHLLLVVHFLDHLQGPHFLIGEKVNCNDVPNEVMYVFDEALMELIEDFFPLVLEHRLMGQRAEDSEKVYKDLGVAHFLDLAPVQHEKEVE